MCENIGFYISQTSQGQQIGKKGLKGLFLVVCWSEPLFKTINFMPDPLVQKKTLGDMVPEVSIGVRRNLGIIKSELSNANKEFDISHVLKAKKMEHWLEKNFVVKIDLS